MIKIGKKTKIGLQQKVNEYVLLIEFFEGDCEILYLMLFEGMLIPNSKTTLKINRNPKNIGLLFN